MFAFRGISVSFSMFFLLYAVVSMCVAGAWRAVRWSSEKYSARRQADLLFALRMLPLAVSAGVTLAFAVPSFLMLEPRVTDELVGRIPLLLGFCGMALVLVGAVNAMTSLLRASRAITAWAAGHGPVLDSEVSVRVLRISRLSPALTAAGILRAQVFLSEMAESVLTGGELHTALRHEVAHVRRRDNLKKLLLRLVGFPGMAELEAAWLEITEMAADDAAVSTAGEALDLAAALIKLSRLGPLHAPVELATALLHTRLDSVNARVERLIAWSDAQKNPAGGFFSWYALAATLAIVAAVALSYSEVLVRVHSATEWLVR